MFSPSIGCISQVLTRNANFSGTCAITHVSDSSYVYSLLRKQFHAHSHYDCWKGGQLQALAVYSSPMRSIKWSLLICRVSGKLCKNHCFSVLQSADGESPCHRPGYRVALGIHCSVKLCFGYEES